MSILHVTDLHVRRGRPRSPGIAAVLRALEATPVDLVVLTGDYMNYPGDERSTLKTLQLIGESSRARFGVWATFGNHDSWRLFLRAPETRDIHWLSPELSTVDPIPGVPLTLVGSNEPEDFFHVATAEERAGRPLRDRFCIALAHYPTEVYTAATIGIPIVLAGHTHGGQFRLSARCAPHTSCDLPPHLATGVLRYGETLCCVSRGVGQAIVELRLNCAAQIPLYVLRRGEIGAAKWGLQSSRAW